MTGSNSRLSGAINKPQAVLEGNLTGEASQLGGDIPGDLNFYAPERDIPKYDGPYTVTPSTKSQTLETAGMMMENDTTINAIPVYEVSNTAGGTTVYIGTEV